VTLLAYITLSLISIEIAMVVMFWGNLQDVALLKIAAVA
jgi:hypothetical protein